MSYTPPDFIHDYANRMAPLTRRQMPVFAYVGKGIPGDSFRIELDFDGDIPALAGISHSESTDEDTVEWTLSLQNITPMLHYELWTGVRLINNELCHVYWYNISAVLTVGNDDVTLWQFDTPYVKRFEYDGEEDLPADTKIDEG